MFVLIGIIAPGEDGDAEDPEPAAEPDEDVGTNEPGPVTDDTPDPQPEPEPESDPEPELEPEGFGDGTHRVGDDIETGTYRFTRDGGLCYWATLSGFSDELADIIANGNSPTVVDISESDAGFTALGCGTWTRD